MLRYTLILLLFAPFLGNTQQEITVIDIQTKETIPFVKIVPSVGQPQLTDIDGKVKLDLKEANTFKVSFFDYKDTVVTAEELRKSKIIKLVPDLQSYDEVVIRSGENPAHRIIRNAMNNRKENDPLRNNSFTYESFSRFYADGEPTEEFDIDTITDSSLLRTIKMFEEQYLFLTETAATRIFSPPSFDKEVVSSYKVSGIKDPMFATLVNQFQSFSFYDNSFDILGKDYINPIAPGSLRRYFFVLEDTLVKDQDTTFTIRFRPSKGKNFEGLKGYLYINTNGWALERVVSEPYEGSENFNIKTIQEYKFTNDKKWFPYNISTEFSFNDVMVDNKHQLVGKSNLYIKNVEFDIPVKKRFNAIKIEVSEEAEGDTLGLEKARGTAATDKEKTTYLVWDTLARESNLDRFVEGIKILSTGKIPIKKINIPIRQIMSFNQYEGYRLGAGLETNRRLSKVFRVGGYFAYGFRDEAWKWGGDFDLTLYKRREVKLSLLYADDVFERGGVDFRKDNFDLTSESSYRDLYLNTFDRQRKASIGLSGLITPNLKVQMVGNYRRIHILNDYAFSPTGLNLEEGSNGFDIAETGVIATWNLFEKVMMLGDQRVSLGTKYPKFTFKAMKGLDNIFGGEYDYYRLNFEVEQDFSIRGFGKLSFASKSGLTQGNVPLVMQHVYHASRADNFGITVPNTFETMFPAEFFSDRFSSLFMRMTFLPFKNKTSWTEPQISIHSAAGYGAMDNRTDHLNVDFSVPDKGFFESGLILDNLLMWGFNGFGAGVFYRYGEYAFPEWKDNFVIKASLKFNF